MLWLRRAVVTLALVPLFWIGAVGNSSAGAVTIRQDPTLHGLVLVSPYPGWRAVSQTVLDPYAEGLRKSLGTWSIAFGGWQAPTGNYGLLFIVLGRLPKGYPPGFRGAPLRVRTSYAKGLWATNGGFRSAYLVIAGSPLSMVGMCRQQFKGGFVTFAMATTLSNNQEFLVSIGPKSLSGSQLQQVAATQFQALR